MTYEDIAFPESGYKGLVFDLDGTLVNSMPTHFKSWCIALAEQGAPGVFPEDVFYAMGGRATEDIVAELNDELGLHLDPDAVANSKRTAFLNLLPEVQPVAPVIEFVRKNKGVVPMAIATGGTRAVAEATLEALQISDLFDTLVTADDVSAGKPDPETFLKAAHAIGVLPEECVAFEDATPGILSAQAAGMQVITVPTPLNLLP